MKQILFIIISLTLISCEAFDYHPYDGRVFGETNINAKNVVKIENACKNKDTIRFVWMGDTQGHYDETEDFVKIINKRNDIDFVIHGGDISDFGATKEFTWMRDIMNKLHVPYVVIIGNHDCVGSGKEVFKDVFGAYNFSFVAGKIKFLCLNTNAIEFNYKEAVPDLTFIDKEYARTDVEYEKTVVAMHARPYHEQFNNNVADIFHYKIKRFTNLQFCANAHAHTLTADDIFNDGIIYYGCEDVSLRNYMIFTITPNGYSYEAVDF